MTATQPSHATEPRDGHSTARAAGAHPHAATAAGEHRPSPRGVQSVKFSFFRVSLAARRLPLERRAALGAELLQLIETSSQQMLTRVYTTAGMRADTDFVVWQAHDDLRPISDWHALLLQSEVGAWLERPHSYLSMTMRSLYTNPIHAGSEQRDRLRSDGGQDEYLFVYPMAKTREWYALPREERQAMMEEHIAIGHRYHGIKINTTYSYGLDDQEFVVAFEGNDPGEFLALVRELRESRASSYTLFDTPMFTCRRVDLAELLASIGLSVHGSMASGGARISETL